MPTFAKPDLHTSKRMHFIEGGLRKMCAANGLNLHTSKRMHFIEGTERKPGAETPAPCIRQNVCTSLRAALTLPNIWG